MRRLAIAMVLALGLSSPVLAHTDPDVAVETVCERGSVENVRTITQSMVDNKEMVLTIYDGDKAKRLMAALIEKYGPANPEWKIDQVIIATYTDPTRLPVVGVAENGCFRVVFMVQNEDLQLVLEKAGL